MKKRTLMACAILALVIGGLVAWLYRPATPEVTSTVSASKAKAKMSATGKIKEKDDRLVTGRVLSVAFADSYDANASEQQHPKVEWPAGVEEIQNQ